MNLKDFKEWLNQFPDDTIVETLVVKWGYYNDVDVTFTPFDQNNADLYDFIDLEGNPHVTQENPNYNKRFLYLGSN